MKKQAFKNSILVLLAILLCVSSLSGCGEQQKAPEPTVPEEKETFQQLFGFESYEEITGTKLAMGNMLGSMEINTDAQYLTQGSGSMKISVQGNYDEPAEHPYFKLDFLNTTCATCDFSKFRSISFDVYNASEEELHIKASINVGKEDGNYIGTAKETFTLKAKSWTTCTYDLSKMAGFSIYDFTSVRYLTVEFMEHKQSREDAPNVLYIDNLIGTYFADGEQPEVVTYDFYEGIDFETAGKELLFTGQGKDNDAAFERVSYDSLGIGAPENGGSYALRLSHETNLWPTFRINFGKELAAGTVISFDAYGRINGESVYNQSIFEYSDGGEATVQFNCDVWTKLSFTLKTAGSYVDLFWNYDRALITSDKATGEVFIDNIVATDPIPPIEPEGNLWDGLDFEIPGNAGLFVGQKIEGDERRDATIERVAYSDLEIPALENGGEYALKLSHDSNYWPTFRINFGEELPKGTIITFQAYARITSGTNNFNQSIFEYSAGGEATDQFKCDAWTELSMKLPENAEYIDLFWNYDRAQITSETASAEVYIDNVIATPGKTPIKPVGDFYKGLDFEIIGNVGYFVGQEVDEKNDAKIEWVAYDDVRIPVPEKGGSHLMKLSHDSFYWPAFRMNFGKVLPAGTKITFMAYGTIKGETLYNQSIFEFTGGGDATKQFPCDQWTELTITLPKTASYVDLFWNYDRAGIVSSASGAVYIDNMIATEPVEPTGDFLEGIDFETPGNELRFGAVGGENAWRDATLEVVSFDGDNALKITCASSQWPVFRMNFGKTLKAGTVISFQAYSQDTSDPERNTVSIFESIPGESYLVYTSSNGATDQYYYNSWSDLKIVLTESREYVDLVCNMDRWNEPGPANLEVYVDNFKAVEPAERPDPTGDFTEGIDFETEGNELYFTGTGADQDAAIERVAYADANVSAPANGGSYALKVSHASNCWPNFRVNFGKTLKAGTTITFDVYGNYDYAAAAGVNKYMKLELAAESKSFAESEDPNQVVWTLVETWNTGITVTLTADSDHIDFFYNVADGQHGEVSSWLLMDNFLAVEPSEPEDPVVDITKGLDFETVGQEQLFTGTGAPQDAAMERVAYADANVSAPANGGSYALKVSHASNCWPNFRVSFGKTLKAGTTITFDVYGNYDYAAAAGVNKYMKLELTAESKSFAESEDPNQVVWTLVETWKTGITVTLTADSDHIDFFYNVADGQHGEVASWLLLDNFLAVEPGTEDPSGENLDFEKEEDAAFFTGLGIPGRDAVIERITYTALGIAAPENGGEYALKLSHDSNYWPTFRISFGRTLAAGTKIVFDAYGKIYGENLYNQSIFEYTAGGEATEQFVHDGWKKLTITLKEAADHLDLFWNYDRANIQSATASGEVYIDNMTVEEP